MKKLNKSEIAALAQKIYSNLNIPSAREVYTKEKEEVIKFYDKQCKLFLKSEDAKILSKYKNVKVYYSETGLPNFKDCTISNYNTNNYNTQSIKGNSLILNFSVTLNLQIPKYPTVNEIQNEIILSQIESTDLKTLIDVVTKKFNYEN